MAKATTPKKPDLGLHWSAHEYLDHQRSLSWFLWFGLITILLATAVYFITARELLPPISIVVVSICLGVFALKKPQQREYSLEADGIRIGESLRVYESFSRFNVFEDDSLVVIQLAPTRRWIAPLSLYVPREIADEVIDHLSHVVVYDERKNTLDEVLHQLRF